ncbi:MAG: mechanosensitive ion channel [Gammaproteobacteria bacterium]
MITISLRTTLALTLWLLLSGLLLLPAVQAEDATPIPKDVDKTLANLEQQIKRQRLPEDQLEASSQLLLNLQQMATKCIADSESELQRHAQDLEGLGEKVRAEDRQVGQKRQSLKNAMEQIERTLGQCRLLKLRSDEIYQSLLNYQKLRTKQQLLHKGPDLLRLLQENWQQPGLWIEASKQFIFTDSGLGVFFKKHWPSLLLGLLLSFVLAWGFRLLLKRLINNGRWTADYTSRFLCACLTSIHHYAIPTLGTLLFVIFIALYYRDIPEFLQTIMQVLPVFYLLITTLRIFLIPPPPAVNFINLYEPLAHQFKQRIKYLLALLLIAYLLFQTILSQSLPEPALLLARAIFATLFVLNLIWLVLLLGQVPRFSQARLSRLLLVTLIGLTLFIEWAGYRNLSFYILRALLGTMLTLGLFSVSKRLVSETFNGLAHNRNRWHHAVRRWLSVPDGEAIPGLTLLGVIVNLLLWLSLAWVLMQVWDFSEANRQQLLTAALSGFQVGSLNIVPARIMLAIGSFALLTIITGWIKNRLSAYWRNKSRLERGAREAAETISGYLGFALTVIVSLSIAGADFTHLAIIAGALSVGIGFGLQNIVNNFVSGLILLFERPIKTGDWIIVGTTEGYVKRIRIRSTQIQTFDRADVIVPNSELISGQVTNWMLHDNEGRVTVRVGVAYGTDTEKVKALLLHCASENAHIIQDTDKYQPKVLFMGFGESSLDFQLRVFVQNIDDRLSVISDLNFAIDKIFRENNIEIPFPQRDIHIRSMPESFSGSGDKDAAG